VVAAFATASIVAIFDSLLAHATHLFFIFKWYAPVGNDADRGRRLSGEARGEVLRMGDWVSPCGGKEANITMLPVPPGGLALTAFRRSPCSWSLL
jgi:hypothetical protein